MGFGKVQYEGRVSAEELEKEATGGGEKKIKTEEGAGAVPAPVHPG